MSDMDQKWNGIRGSGTKQPDYAKGGIMLSRSLATGGKC